MRDTLDIVINNEITSAITEIAQSNDKSIDPIYNVLLTVMGMIAVALITAFSQHWISKKAIRADFEKLNKQMKLDFEKVNFQFKTDFDKIGLQVKSDFHMKMKFDSISNIRTIISDLITTTDSDYNKTVDQRKMLYLINQAQIVLDIENEEENRLACLITELGHAVNADRSVIEEYESSRSILIIQREIIELTRIILRAKQNIEI